MSNPNTKELKLPAKFDPAKHAAIMERKVKEELGSDWSISHIDKQRWRLVAVRHTSMTSMNDEVRLSFLNWPTAQRCQMPQLLPLGSRR